MLSGPVAECISLFELYNLKDQLAWRGWRDFEGRAACKQAQAPLYPNLQFAEGEPLGGVRPSDRRRAPKDGVMEQG